MWVWLALGSALSLSLSDVAAKKALRSADPWVVAWVKLAGAALVTSPIFFFTPWPEPWPFLGIVALAVPLELAALYGYHRAIAQSPLSMTVPMLAFTPVFLLGVAGVLLGEAPGMRGAGGVLLVAMGAYLLPGSGGGVFAPLRAIWREPGARTMLLVAAVYAFTATLGKLAVGLAEPLFFGAFYPFVLAAVLTPVVLVPRRRAALAGLSPGLVLALGLAYGTMIVFHFSAIVRAPAAFMIAVKRSSLLFAVLWGRLVFDERFTRRRVLGAALMLAGVFVLASR